MQKNNWSYWWLCMVLECYDQTQQCVTSKFVAPLFFLDFVRYPKSMFCLVPSVRTIVDSLSFVNHLEIGLCSDTAVYYATGGPRFPWACSRSRAGSGTSDRWYFTRVTSRFTVSPWGLLPGLVAMIFLVSSQSKETAHCPCEAVSC